MKSTFSTGLVVLGAVLGMHAAGAIELMDLPYGQSKLEPYISREVGPRAYSSTLKVVGCKAVLVG